MAHNKYFFPLNLQKKYKLPNFYYLDFLEGMKKDIENIKIGTKAELIQYCYEVAGVVGLFMCPILNVKNKEALENALSLGIAMQITNICRDIKEDYLKQRVYLPKLHLSKNTFSHPTPLLIKQIQSYLNLADDFYKIGRLGLKSMPLRSAFVIFYASHLYQKIGSKINQNPEKYINTRAFTTPFEKIFILFLCLVKIPKLFRRPKIFNKNKTHLFEKNSCKLFLEKFSDALYN